MASVVKTETQAASSSTASMILSLRLREAFIRASSASRASPVRGTEDTMRSGVVMVLIVVFGKPATPGRNLQGSFALEQVGDGDAHFVLAAEHGALLALG